MPPLPASAEPAEGRTLALAAFAIFTVGAILLSTADLRTRRLPNRALLVFALGVLGVFAFDAVAAGDAADLTAAVAASVIYGLPMALGWRWGGIGGGDVKLAGLIGLEAGWWGLETWTLLVPFGIAACCAVSVAAAALRRTREFSFGPVLLCGAWLGILPEAVRTVSAS